MPRTCAIDAVGKVVLVAHGAEPIEDAEWTPFVELVQKRQPDAIVVYTSGAAPSSAQRNQLRTACPAMPFRIAVFSTSSVVVGVARILSLFVRNIRVFSPDAQTAALDYAR